MLLNWRTGLHVDKDKVGLVEFSGLREKNTETQPHNFCFAPPLAPRSSNSCGAVKTNLFTHLNNHAGSSTRPGDGLK